MAIELTGDGYIYEGRHADDGGGDAGEEDGARREEEAAVERRKAEAHRPAALLE